MSPLGRRTWKKFVLKAIALPNDPTFGLLGGAKSPPTRFAKRQIWCKEYVEKIEKQQIKQRISHRSGIEIKRKKPGLFDAAEAPIWASIIILWKKRTFCFERRYKTRETSFVTSETAMTCSFLLRNGVYAILFLRILSFRTLITRAHSAF